mgnify:CR=1 FL=1
MVEIKDQTKIETLENAWYNCGILSTATTENTTSLPISDVRNVININYAFAIDEDFRGKKSYIDNVATMETVDPDVIDSAKGTFQNNQLVGTSTGANGEENRTNLKTMFANNVDLTVDGIPSDVKNGKVIFEKLSEIVFNKLDTDDDSVIYNHVQYFPYLDGHTTCFSKNQGTTTIGTGNVLAVSTSAITNKFYFNDETLTETGDGLLQTEVAFSVTNGEGDTKTILSKITNDKEEKTFSSGNIQTVKVDTNGNFQGNESDSISTDVFTLSWDGTPCTNGDMNFKNLSNKLSELPNNMNFRVSHKLTIKSGTTFTVQPGAIVEIASGGSIVVESGATVNIKEGIVNIKDGGVITVEGTLNNNFLGIIANNGTITNSGTITNNGTIKTVKDGINGNPVDGNQPIIIKLKTKIV